MPTTPVTEAAIEWSDTFLLGLSSVDEEHRTFVALLATLQQCPDAAFEAHLDRFADHARTHFQSEDDTMEQGNFPVRACHMDEHAAVLRSVDAVHALVCTGDFAEGRRLAGALADWFPGHVQHLDSALADWVCKQRFSAKPLVLRRGVARSQAEAGQP